jgi:hypothetical protein
VSCLSQAPGCVPSPQEFRGSETRRRIDESLAAGMSRGCRFAGCKRRWVGQTRLLTIRISWRHGTSVFASEPPAEPVQETWSSSISLEAERQADLSPCREKPVGRAWIEAESCAALVRRPRPPKSGRRLRSPREQETCNIRWSQTFIHDCDPQVVM